MKNLFLLLIFTGVTVLKTSAQIKIAAKDVSKHIGQTATIRDKVFGTKEVAISKNTLLFLGGNYPNQQVTVLMEGAATAVDKVAPANYQRGRSVNVTGKLVLVNGHPAIVVNRTSQLKLELIDNIIPTPVKLSRGIEQ